MWAEWLTIYHAIFSIAIPITLIELAYPERRNDRWLSDKKLFSAIILLSSVTVFGYFFLTAYRPPLPQYLFSTVTVLVLTLLAWKTPFQTGKSGRVRLWTPRKLFIVGFFTATTFFLLYMAGPYLVSQPIILITFGFGLVFAAFSLVKRFEWNEEALYHKFCLTTGAVAFLIVLTPIQEFDNSRLDNTQGMLLVGITALIMLLLLRRRLRTYMLSTVPLSSTEKNGSCSNCSESIPSNALFCPSCGTKCRT